MSVDAAPDWGGTTRLAAEQTGVVFSSCVAQEAVVPAPRLSVLGPHAGLSLCSPSTCDSSALTPPEVSP
ncbi:hypothetical protein HNQ07_003485 [Deinococcus metalli]|uniref:Uncharacterized protein n=1 Tax=Deinococcus metalli TaxID=1141878 RepID=A0A7W8KK31_9DEIO|nr:hypothetical protein [Deinococcus metalli]MBB5377984.1 hypothetical protein [Deinococcus metalli]GHF53545.1 hypothetical protein GCM10017781_32200 [Deinococcus metalli]